jgi:hypothetical protein
VIVYIAGSLRDFDKDVLCQKKIIEVIHDHSATISQNWLDAAIARHENDVQIADWTPIVRNNLEALKRSDVVIIETSHYSFSQGFYMAAALEHKKPVLVISRNRLHHKYITGITDPMLSFSEYSSEEELTQAIASFLKKNTIHTKDLRFNFFMTRRIAQYIDEKSKETGKTRSDIIRSIIKRSGDSRSAR